MLFEHIFYIINIRLIILVISLLLGMPEFYVHSLLLPAFAPPPNVYETILAVLVANFILLYISIFYVFFTKNKFNIRLIILVVSLFLLLGIPAFYMPNLINDLIIFFALVLYPSILVITRLKYRFEQHRKILIILTIIIITAYVTYNEVYFSSTPYLPYPLYALATAIPEFFIIFIDNCVTVSQLIVVYESLLNIFFTLPYISSRDIILSFITITPEELLFILLVLLIFSFIGKKYESKFLILHLLLSFAFLGVFFTMNNLPTLYYLQSPY